MDNIESQSKRLSLKISRTCAAQSPHLVRDSVQEEDLHRLQQGGQPCLRLDPIGGRPLVDGMKIQLVTT